MCLSTIYNNKVDDGNILMNNVMTIEVKGPQVVLTDLMGRTKTFTGTLVKAFLADGYAIVNVDPEALNAGK